MTTSMAELEGMLARLTLTMQELAESHKETERVLKESGAEADRRMAESKAETDRLMAESKAETDRRIAELSAEADKRIAKLERTVEKTTKQMGGLHNSIGEIVELILVPGLKKKMNMLKHNFSASAPRKSFEYPNGRTLTEVDLLLEGCETAMAVEVKRHLTTKWVGGHLKRLQLMREYERITGVEGKTMYAAVAGMQIDADARALAEENGMYIVSIEEDTERLRIDAPGVARVW